MVGVEEDGEALEGDKYEVDSGDENVSGMRTRRRMRTRTRTRTRTRGRTLTRTRTKRRTRTRSKIRKIKQKSTSKWRRTRMSRSISLCLPHCVPLHLLGGVKA